MNYIGIDLGTTNSVICSYNGAETKVWKSPEQNDVTPSAIYIDKRGKRYYGRKAEDFAVYEPDNAAILFKRFMGTGETFKFKDSRIAMKPEDCSSEIIKLLYGYLPEEIRKDENTVTVITVPAVFNQMKKDATIEAAKKAGLGKVAIMQEPVAAVMSIMKNRKKDGRFLVYDLGGGTFDVSVAENVGGSVALLAHGGREMCGGRDIDRQIFNKIIKPWLAYNFTLPKEIRKSGRYENLCRTSEWVAEKAKIELSSSDNATIALSEMESRTSDREGKDIFIDITISRTDIEPFVNKIVKDTIKKTEETLAKAGLSSADIDEIVFVGGPTAYKPLRDKVSEGLGIKSNIDVNPMTAVSEGAAIYAEAIDWGSEKHGRKKSTNKKKGSLDVQFSYRSRTTENTTWVKCDLQKKHKGYQIEFVNCSSGWRSGKADLKDGLEVELKLAGRGRNVFRAIVYDGFDVVSDAKKDLIFIDRTVATIDAIPASHSIGMEVIEGIGGASKLEFLVREGDALPKNGHIVVKAGETVEAGSTDSLNIKLWEGDIESNIEDNRFIGLMKISGNDFDEGVIPVGAEIECSYEMDDSGAISLEATVPCLRTVFNRRNFYSRQEGQALMSPKDIYREGKYLVSEIIESEKEINDERLEEARSKANEAMDIDFCTDCDSEQIQEAQENLLEAKRIMSFVRRDNIKHFRRKQLDDVLERMHMVRHLTSDGEWRDMERFGKTCMNAVEVGDPNFDNMISSMGSMISTVRFRDDRNAIELYKRISSDASRYKEPEKFWELKMIGDKALEEGNMDTLRHIFFSLQEIRTYSQDDGSMFDKANIIMK